MCGEFFVKRPYHTDKTVLALAFASDRVSAYCVAQSYPDLKSITLSPSAVAGYIAARLSEAK